MCEFISFSILQNISGISKRKYTQKPRAMQMNFINLLYGRVNEQVQHGTKL